MADEAIRTKADAIVLDVEGSVIAVDDASDNSVRNLKLFGRTTQTKTTGKNLLNATLAGPVLRNGVTFMPEYDSSGQLLSITANGTAGEQSYVTVAPMMELPAGEYILSGCPSGGDGSTYDVRFNGINARDYGEGVRFEIGAESIQNSVTCVVAPGATVQNLKFYPMIRLASVIDSTFEPHSSGYKSPSPEYQQPLDSVVKPTVTIRTKNLFDGAMSTCAFSGSYVVFNEAYRGFYVRVEPGKTYTVSRSAITSNRFQVMFTVNEPVDNEKIYNRVWADEELSITAIAPHGCKWLMCYLSNASEDVSNTLYQVEEGSVVTDYEPYIEPQTITLNRTLNGVPVSNGGNYTDENGQQWICDEVDFERRVYIQRIGVIEFDGSADEDWGGVSAPTENMRSWITVADAYRSESDTGVGIMCSQFSPNVSMDTGAFYQNRDRFFFGSGMTLTEWRSHLQTESLELAYILTTPIETPLTSEETLAYRALKTNKPNTTVVNDQNTHMVLSYSADTLKFLRDNQPGPTDDQVKSAVNSYLDDHIESLISEYMAKLANETR